MWYDEAGNRIRKMTVLNFVGGGGGGEIPDWAEMGGFGEYDPEVEPPITEGDNWQIVSDEWYVRDIAGNEIALYNSSDLKQWNVGKEGKIDADGKRYFFLKDHLGTVRAVIDTAHNVVEANDVDMWGYRMKEREYTTSVTDNDYLFTGKERDSEKSGYDYFGARYLNSRIGRWSSIDPLLEKYFGYTPYNYTLNNSINSIDPMGLDVYILGDDRDDAVDALNDVFDNIELSIDENGKLSANGTGKTEEEKKKRL